MNDNNSLNRNRTIGLGSILLGSARWNKRSSWRVILKRIITNQPFGSSAFSVQTDAPERDFGIMGGGLSVLLTDSISAYLDYQTQAGQKNFSTHSVNGGVKLEF